MKILVVCGAGYVYGKEIVTLSLIDGLTDLGHDVRCITTIWTDGQLARILDSRGVRYTSLPLGFVSKTFTWPAMRMSLHQVLKLPVLWRGYARTVRAFAPDVVLHNNFHHLTVLWPMLDCHKTFFHVHEHIVASGFYRLAFRLLSRRLRGFIAVSDFIRGSLITLGVAPGLVHTVRNGITVGRIEDDGRPSVDPERVAVSSKLVRIGIVGQIGTWKGHDDLITALCQLKASKVPFTCAIFGDGQPDYVSELKERIESCQLTDCVQWKGFVENRAEIFSCIDICVIPSRCQEAFCLVAIEAAQFGIPVVASRRGALPELVQDGRTGWLVDAESPSQLAEKLTSLIQHEARRSAMGLAARCEALATFTPERMARQMEEALQGGAVR